MSIIPIPKVIVPETKHIGTAVIATMIPQPVCRAMRGRSDINYKRIRLVFHRWRHAYPRVMFLEDHGYQSFLLRSEEHTSELQSLMRLSYAVFCLKKKTNIHNENHHKCSY